MTESGAQLLFLTKDVFVAKTNGALVFLNRKENRYVCLETKYTSPFSILMGLDNEKSIEPVCVTGHVVASETEIAQTVTNMVEHGFMTRNSAEGKRACFIEEHKELREMLGYPPQEGPKIRVSDVVNFFRSLLVTKQLVRGDSLDAMAARIHNRRRRRVLKGDHETQFERINELVEIFKILKPLFVTVKDECLFNSLFLIEFLACYRVYPSWYHGVRLNDFYAHCWVQYENYILDDMIVYTSRNRPIMVV